MVAGMLYDRRGRHATFASKALRTVVLASALCSVLLMGVLQAGSYVCNQAFAIASQGARPWPATAPLSQQESRLHHSSHLVAAPVLQGDAHRAGRTRMLAAAVESDPGGIRVGVLVVKGVERGDSYKEAFQKRNVTDNYFETKVPQTSQLALAAKFLAMSNTVDVIVAAYTMAPEGEIELARSLQSVALNTNVPIVACKGENIEDTADTAEAMAEIRQQALFRGGSRGGVFYGIGAANKTDSGKKDKEKVYF
mmetsp:Transcript_9381/g.16981  ORF Transcript_9381/g.16981 Transcript_9381/m.16981 type:complete len:252 (+) Transcript_9381:70-825(+)